MAESSDLFPSELPNPFTPMAFLPPELAYEKAMTTYISIGMLGVLSWDILVHLGADYELLKRHRVGVPTLAYYLSRWSSLLYSILSVMFETAQVENCRTFSKVTCASYHPAVSATALLFFFRVRALYNGNRYITAIFLIMWLAIVGSSVIVLASVTGVHIGNTKYCTFKGFRPTSSISTIIIGVFDTCIFVATTWRLLWKASPADNIDGPGKFRLFGKYLPRFSRALLQDGQNYYMIAVVCNLLVLIMTYTPGIPVAFRSLFLVPSVGLTNIVACRVFRNIKLGYYDINPTDILSKISFGPVGHTISIPIERHVQSIVHSISADVFSASTISEADAISNTNSREKLPQLIKEVSAV